jgi:hypothetical protein
MAYVADPTDATQPVGSVKAKTAAEEFRAIKGYLNGIVAAGLPSAVAQNGKVLGVTPAGAITWVSNAGNNLYSFEKFI